MSWYRRGVQIFGVPGHLFEEELLRDKLMIHFLRPKNQGGEIQDLTYPTKDKGVAILTFEDEEVAERILKTQHLLSVNGQSFPLEVTRPQFSMSVITSLDVSRLKNQKLLGDLMEKHKVVILDKRDEMLSISAEFEDLRRFRSEIMAKALTCDTPPLGQRSRKQISVPGSESPVKDNPGVKPSNQQPSGNNNNLKKPKSRKASNRSSSQEKYPSGARRREANMAPAFSNSYSLGHRPTTNSVAQGSNPTPEGGMSFKPTRDPIVRMNDDSVSQKLSDLNLDSSTTNRGQPSGEAIRTTRKPSAVTKDFPSQTPLVKSFPVDKDVLHYILVFEKQSIHEVLRRGYVDIEVAEDEDISHVTIKSQSALKLNFEYCCDEILQIFSKWQGNLRTEDLDLTQFLPMERREITEKIKYFGYIHGVAIISNEDVLHLIGVSSQIHQLKDWWTTISQPKPPEVGREAVNTREIHLPHPPDMGRSYAGANEKKTNNGDQDLTQNVRWKASGCGSSQTVGTTHQSGGSMRRKTSTETSSVSSRTGTNSNAHSITHPKPNR